MCYRNVLHYIIFGNIITVTMSGKTLQVEIRAVILNPCFPTVESIELGTGRGTQGFQGEAAAQQPPVKDEGRRQVEERSRDYGRRTSEDPPGETSRGRERDRESKARAAQRLMG